MGIHVKKSNILDAIVLEKNIKKIELEEIEATGKEPLTALIEGLRSSDFCYSIIDERGKVLGMFGVARLGENIGCPWLLCSDELSKHYVTFLRHSLEYVEKMQENYDLLVNCVSTKNKESIRWLKHLGFVFHEDSKIQIRDVEFIRFTREKKRCAKQEQ